MHQYVFVITVGLLCLISCSQNETTGVTNSETTDLGKARDTATNDRNPNFDAQVSDAETIDDLRDVDSGIVNVDINTFEMTAPCEGVRELPPASIQPFEVPTRPPGEPIPTRENLVQRLGDPLPVVSGIIPDPRHQPGSGPAVDLWAEPGDDVTIHVAFGFPRKEALETFRFNLTVMLDYKPVKAKYVRWDDNRVRVLESRDATGVRYSMDSDVELIEVVIPSDEFSEARAYEVGVAYKVTNLVGSRILGGSRRLMTYYGGFGRGSAPCIPLPLGDNAREHEAEFRNPYIGSEAIFVAYHGMPQDPDEPRRVSPGERIEFLASHFRLSHQPTPSMVQPVLNGRPLGEPQMLAYGAPGGGFPQTVDGRTTFEVTFPRAPGEYELLVMAWPHAYQLARTPEGEINEDVDISMNIENSNPLHFIVDDTF